MPDSPAASPRPAAPPRRIKPAGWVVILLAVLLLVYLATRKQKRSPSTTPPPGPSVTAPPARAGGPAKPIARPRAPPPASVSVPIRTTPAPAIGIVLAPQLFPRPGTTLPPAHPTALANVVLPALVGVRMPAAGAQPAVSEREAILEVARGDADQTIASVAALAAVPEAVQRGVKAVWLVGFSPPDGALFPSCDAAALRQTRLGFVPGSLGELDLLAALAGSPVPPMVAFDTDSDLARAIDDGIVTGGPARGRARARGGPTCEVLPDSTFALVAIRDTRKPMSPQGLAALVGLGRSSPLPASEVVAFFDPHRAAPGGFAKLFAAAGKVWSAAGLIGTPAVAQDAVDWTFLSRPSTRAHPAPGAGVATPAPNGAAAREKGQELGFPSWVDR